MQWLSGADLPKITLTMCSRCTEFAAGKLVTNVIVMLIAARLGILVEELF